MRCVSNDKGTEIGMFPKIGVPPNHPCDFRIFHDFPLSTIQRAWGTLMAMETFSFYIKQVHFMTYGFHLCWDLLGCIQLNQVFLTSAVPPVHRKALKDLRKNVAGLVRKWWSQSNLWQKWSEKGLIH